MNEHVKDLQSDTGQQNRLSAVFKKLEKAGEECRKQAIQAANHMNGIAMSCLYSGPEKQMAFRNAQINFERCKSACNIHKQLLEIFIRNRVENGNISDAGEITKEIDKILKSATETGDFRAAGIVNEYKEMLSGQSHRVI